MPSSSWTCPCCGRAFETLPLDYASPAPFAWTDLPAAEREDRGWLSTDLCVIDGEHFFVRACLAIPVPELDDVLNLGVWAAVSERTFRRVEDLWDAADDAIRAEPARPCLLNARLPTYPDTLNLEGRLRLRAGNLRPAVELEPALHRLADDQREGVSVRRVQELAARFLHGRPDQLH